MMDHKREHPDCAFVRQSLPLYTGGDLGRAATAKVEAHLRACRPCADLGANAVAARTALVVGLGAGAAPERVPDILAGVRSRLVADAAPLAAPLPAPARRLRLLPWIGAGAAAAAAAVALYIAVATDGGTARAPGAGLVADADAAPGGVPHTAPGERTSPVGGTTLDGVPAPRRPADPVAANGAVLLAGSVFDGDALRPLQQNEVPLRHSALRTVEVPWMENNAGRVLTPGGAVSAVGWTVPVR